RPLPAAEWDYLFYMDCDGHAADPNLHKALKEVEAYAVFYKLLGAYPKARRAAGLAVKGSAAKEQAPQ
ncbi:MAG TPA: hypothetical protein VLF62_03445, partial [Candidatus Saccharimonadales bacterium]|nr:hypothetical protein [Candidatus Saccharimonadales bacterium]